MADPKGFLKYSRENPERIPVSERVRSFKEFTLPQEEEGVRKQGSRCMDCGVAFCQSDYGCPVKNLIPDWNDLVHQGRWKEALKILHLKNNFPEFTGKLCPAPCETACVLGLIDDPVSIRSIEWNIVERGFEEGWIEPVRPATRSGKKVAVIGSGPAGLAAAQQLARSGHSVTVFEKADRAGGLLRYGIPDFKMEKGILERRIEQLVAEGVEFRLGVQVGVDFEVEELILGFDAVCLAIGAEQPRDLPIHGRELQGIHFAMPYLEQQNRRVAGNSSHFAKVSEELTAAGKNVVVIGGGDTGSDCVGTARRQGCLSVSQFELLPKPPSMRDPSTPWPLWPMQLRTSHAHEEGCQREWSYQTTHFSGENGRVTAVHGHRVRWEGQKFHEIPGSKFEIPAELVLIAAGFTGPVKSGLIEKLAPRMDSKGNISVDSRHWTGVPKVFAAGDVRRGASLIVWAIHEGRMMAEGVNRYLGAPHLLV